MEKILRKTMTAFLVLLTLMIPVSASIYAPANTVISVTEGDQMIDVTFSYDNTSLSAGTITLAFAGDAVLDNTQTNTLSAVTGQDSPHTVSTPLSSGLAVGTHNFTLNVSQSTWSDVITYTVNVNAATSEEACSALITNDGELEDEYNPGDTVNLELELENEECGGSTWTDVVFEAWLTDSNGRISSVEDTAEFNLGDEEEDTLRFSFDLEDDADAEETYQVVVRATADEAAEYLWMSSNNEFSFDVEREEHSLLITDVQYDASAQAGETVDVAVTMLNNGEGDEGNVQVSLSVAGAAQTSSYFTIEEDEEVVRYFTLTVPNGASGEELLVVRAANADASDSYSGSISVGAAASDSTSLTEDQIEALLDARLSSGDSDSGVSVAWIIAGLLLVWMLHQNGGLRTKPTRGRKKSKKVYY